jgi:hypothetical protein
MRKGVEPLSSILDALKRAERESTPNGGMVAPRHPLSARSPNRQRFRWWWVLLGVVFVSGVSGLIVWQVQHRAAPGPAASVGAAPVSVKSHDKEAVPTATAPRQAARRAPTNPPAQSITQPVAPPPPAAPPEAEPVVPPQRKTASPAPGAVSVPAAPKRPPVETAAVTMQPAAASQPENEKTFRSDPRIDLQALVWAPEAATRFVVINNRLIKEGGSVGNITVVKINPDDVLLAEGSDRWHVAFQIR